MKILKSPYLRLLLIDLFLLILFRYYQPVCEPCFDNSECPICMSSEQYFIVYSALAINIIVLSVNLIKRKTKRSPLISNQIK